MRDMLQIVETIGLVAFALSGAVIGISRKMDLFGVLTLSVTASCGGGLIRDLIIGHTPPSLFTNPMILGEAVLVALVVFIVVKLHPSLPAGVSHLYDEILFLFDTLGLAAFSVDGVMVGVDAGYGNNIFLITFLGLITGVGGGILRDIFADQIPGIFQKHIYALACLAGSLTTALLCKYTHMNVVSMICGFCVVLVLRLLAAHFRWNLPKAE